MKLMSDNLDFIAVLVLAAALGGGLHARLTPAMRASIPAEEVRAAAHEARAAMHEARSAVFEVRSAMLEARSAVKSAVACPRNQMR